MDAGQIGSGTTCYRHPQRETYVRCSRCNRPICPNCMNEAAVGFQCPECVRDGRRTVRQASGRFGGGVVGRREYVTFALIGINIAVFALGIGLSGMSAITDGGGLFSSSFTPVHLWGSVLGYTVQDGGELYTGIVDGAYYRLLTAEFVHFGIFHLAVNMWALWIVGRDLERVLGHVRFLGLYLVSGLGGSVAAYVFANPLGLTAGASGAIFGLFGALFFVARKLGRDTAGVLTIIAINVVFTLMMWRSISVAGHVGGLITGALLAVGIAYAPRSRRGLVQAGAFAAVGVVLLILVLLRTQQLDALDPSTFT